MQSVVYVLMSSIGEYSDRVETVRGVFTDGDAARAIAERLDGEYRKRRVYEEARWKVTAPFVRELSYEVRSFDGDVERLDEPFRSQRRAYVAALAGFEAEHGPAPACGDDCHWVVAVPLNTLGAWKNCEYADD